MSSRKNSMALTILAFAACTTSTPVSASSSEACGLAVTSYITLMHTVSSMISGGIIRPLASSQSTLQGSSSTVSSVASTSSSSSSVVSIPPLDCHENNCLRQFIKAPQIPSFCATYTTTVNTIITGLPDYVSMCDADPSQISSACSCLTTTASSMPSPTTMDCQQNNCLRQFMNPTNTQVTPFCNTYTTAINSTSNGLPDFVSMCSGDPSQISSACSCVATSPVASSSSTRAKTPSSTLASSLGTSVSAPVSAGSTSIPSSSSGTQTSSSGATAGTVGGVFGSLTSTSAASSSLCSSLSFVLQTTTTNILVTITTNHLPTSAISTTSVTMD